MRFTSTLTTLALTAISIALCEGAGLRAAAAGAAAARNDQGHRALSGGYRQVFAAMETFYKSKNCSTQIKGKKFQKNKGQTITKCTIPGGEATFKSRGTTQDPEPLTLTVCQLSSDEDCKTFNFDGTKAKAQQIIEEAFSNGGFKKTSGFVKAMDTLVPRFNGDCSVKSSSGDTKVSCSEPGFTAELSATGNVNQSLKQLKTCQQQTGGNTKCKTFNFNNNKNVNSVLQEALGRNTRSAKGDYEQTLLKMILFFDGQCTVDFANRGSSTTVSCSRLGTTGELNASGVRDQSAQKLDICRTLQGKQHCKTYSYTESNLKQILKEAFP